MLNSPAENKPQSHSSSIYFLSLYAYAIAPVWMLTLIFEILQILSISIFEKVPINQLFQQTQLQYFKEQNHNQLKMWD